MKTSRRIVVATAAVAAFASGAGIAFAAWSTTNSGSGASQAVTVTAPGAPTANGSSTATTIPIQWTAGSVGGATVKYWVQRADFNGSTYSDACGSTQAAPITATSCTDSGLTSSHDYQYKVTVVASNWQATGSISGKLSTTAAPVTLTISSVVRDGGNKKVHFTGTGAVATTNIVVTVCATNSFPCASPVTTATASNPTAGNWTTSQTGANLSTSQQYWAQAKQGTTTSDAFAFDTTAL